MPYDGSVSQEVEDELIYLVGKLGTLRQAASKARSPAELDAKIAEMRLTINRGMRVGHTWAKDDLKKIFNDGYRSFWRQTKPKKDVDAAFNLRKKSRQSMNRLETSLNQWADAQSGSIKAGKALEQIEAAMKTAKGDDVKKLAAQATKLRPLVTGSQIPNVTYFAKRGKRASVAEMPAPAYIRMALRSGHVDNENQGVLRGARQAGIGEILVHDGDECGWVAHDSLPLADGLVVTPAEALRYPKAHPNCQRWFEPPTKERIKEAKARAAARKKAAAVARRAMQKQKAIRAAKVTVKAAAVGYKIYRSPATQILIRNIVQERYALPAPLKEFVAKFARYEAQERSVAQAASLAEKQEVSPDDVRQRVLAWADNVIGAEDDTHSVPVAMQKIMGLPPTASTTRITEATWSYGDWIAKHNGQVRSSVENLVDSGVWAGARQELNDEIPVLASMFHIGNPRGVNVGGATTQTIRVIKDAFSKDAAQITEEAVREVAGLIDPFYWIQGRFGPVKMSVRMSTEGRRDLAAKLFRQIRDTRRWTEVDREAAAKLGVELVEPVTVEDVRRALLPRLTVNPGGLFSFTVASEDGTIRPIFRVLPQWAATRYFGAEFSLASGWAGRIKEAVDQGADLTDVLRGFPQEVISHLNLYRHGPFNAHVNFWGTRFNGYSVYAGKDTDWIRFANRYRRYERVGPGRGQIVPLQRMWSDLSIMPTGWSTITFTGKNRQFDVIANLHHWSGSLVHVAREMRIDYLSLKYWYEEAKKKINYEFEQMHGSELARIRTYSDLKAWADGFKDNATAVADFGVPSLPPGSHNVSELLKHRASAALKRDLDRFNHAWDQLFPHLRRPDISAYTPGDQFFESQEVPLFYRGGEAIYIREDLATSWNDIARVRNRNTFIGFWPQGTEDTVASLWHEAAHHLMNNIGDQGLAALFHRLGDVERFPKYMADKVRLPEFRLKADLLEKLQQIFLGTPETRQWVRNNLSGYATRNIHELIAEAFTEYTTSKHPRPLAMVIGRWLTVYGGQ